MEKDFKNIDDLLRNSLNDFEKKPSERVWKGILSGLPPKGFIGILSSKILWSVLGILVFVTMILFFNYNFNSLTNNMNSAEQQKSLKDNEQNIKLEEESVENSSAKSTDVIIGNQKEMGKTNDPGENNEVNLVSQNTNKASGVSSLESLFSKRQTTEGYEENALANDQKKETYLLTGYYPFLMKGTFNQQLLTEYPVMLKPNYINSRNRNLAYHLPGTNPSAHDDYGKKQKLLYGINFVPELIFPGSDKINKGIGIELTGRYIMNDFYLETGFGFNVSDDDGQYKIDYEQYDSIGYYYKVNSFTIDESTGKPIFNTDLESVYDTVDYTTSESTRNTYTYLYLPLYAGVKLYEFRRLSLNLQAGIIYSVMIGQHEPEASYANDNATRITITNENPSRISSNWIVAASVGLQYQISPTLDLNIEPMVKYYFKPVYERRYDIKATFGAGLRVGLYFKF
jgi:hypothetical protein